VNVTLYRELANLLTTFAGNDREDLGGACPRSGRGLRSEIASALSVTAKRYSKLVIQSHANNLRR
jgi:hypothetical protein